MPDKKTLARVKRDRKQGKAPSTQAGEFIREEFEHIRAGKHGARSPQQAIAIGLSKARRSGVDLRPPAAGQTSQSTREKAERDYERGHGRARGRRASARRGAAAERALKREPHSSASRSAISRQAHRAAGRRTRTERSAAAKRAARTKGAAGRRTRTTRT